MVDPECLYWAEGLEGPCLRIAETEDSPLRVVAGPGTGKTFSLIRRVARLLSDGVEPERILVCTFTRTAALDLKNELQCLGVQGCSLVKAGTIHSFCFSILSRSGVYDLTGRIPRPLFDFEKRFLLEDLKDRSFGDINEMKKRIQAFNAAWARLQSEEPGWPSDDTDRYFHSTLMDWLIFHRAMLIDEVVPAALDYLRNNPYAHEYTQFDHVLIDEYQDLNRSEQVLLDMLAENGTQTVIGDENQSIYSFRCAHPQGIAEFENYHPGTSNESLVECRRCSHLVVKLANSLIQNNTAREKRTLIPFPSNPQGEVHVVQWESIEEEAEGITKFINQKIKKGEVNPGGILVLAPRKQFGYAIRDSLNASCITAASFFQEELLDGKPTVMNASQAQQAITLLTLLVNPDDRVALRCWCGFGSASLNRSAWTRLKEYCQREDLSPREALDMLKEDSIRIPYTNPILNRYTILMERLNEIKNLDRESLLQSLFPMGESWSDPFRYIIRDLDEDEIQPDIILDTLTTSITQPELPTDVDYVRVMSLHKSKGLSADMVVVVGCSEGLIPPRYDKKKTELSYKDFIEEARRLFYVAITRSRNILVLSNVVKIPLHIAHKMRAKVIPYPYTNTGRTVTSKFISELGRSCPKPIRGQNLQ